jgi:glycosyltransferase involved in cell wall biosynthesis
MRIAIVAAARFPIAEPFTGGLEANVWALATGLRNTGHDVTVFAGAGSDPRLGIALLDLRRPRLSAVARADVSMGPDEWLDEHHAYLELMLRLADGHDYDLVHNHSLHHLPIAMAGMLPMPVVSTLHTPPTPWLESAIQARERCPVAFAAVSEHTAHAWRHVVPHARVVPNGVEVSAWTPGPGGGPLIWSGRIAPEKGAHLAIDAAVAASERLDLAGPVVDCAYFEAEIVPQRVGEASAALVTPCWDEPYGLVVAEAMACGTPVCAFARGGLPELIRADCGILVASGDVDGLARAIPRAKLLSRAAVRRRAITYCSLERMVERYQAYYDELLSTAAVA